jgi:ParB/RepB/Spo0J family partition protein
MGATRTKPAGPRVPAKAKRAARTVTLGEGNGDFRQQVGEFLDSIKLPAVMEIPLDKLCNHPANPEPSEAEIVQMAEWLETDGRQEEPIVVRPWGSVELGLYQILAGKRRYLAAERLGWPSLRAVVREDLADDDCAALLLLVRSNAHRAEDTPIRQAELLQTMLRAGLTKEQAGAEFGLKTDSAVNNKLGLLRLPEVWQERVISGEIPQSCAVALAPYAEFPTIMAGFDHAWEDEYDRLDLCNKDRQRGVILDTVTNDTRPIDPEPSLVQQGAVYYQPKDCSRPGWYQRVFDLTPELEDVLQVVALPIGKNGAKVRRAVNVDEFDRLNIAAIEADAAKKAKKTAAKTDKQAGKSALSATSDRLSNEAAEQERAKTLYRKRCEWCGDWLRAVLVECVQEAILGDDCLDRLLPSLRLYDWWAVQRPDHAGFIGEEVSRHEMWQAAAGAIKPGLHKSQEWLAIEANWEMLHEMNEGELLMVRLELVKRLLLAKNRDSRFPVIPLQILIQSADAFGVSWSDAWASSVNPSKLIWLEDWLSFHRAPELIELVNVDWQYGVDIEPNWTAKRMREVILSASANCKLPMPSCLSAIHVDHLPSQKGR